MGKHFITRLFENYCFVLLTNRAPPQISDNRPDMGQRALFVTSRAAWRWNKMLLARYYKRSSFKALESFMVPKSNGHVALSMPSTFVVLHFHFFGHPIKGS